MTTHAEGDPAGAPADPSHERRTPDLTLAEDLTHDHELGDVTADVVACRACPRLVAWRERAPAERPRRYAGWTYWARPVPGYGDVAARLVIVGLAPAAHGGNRTGRIFTGDRSGDVLFAALFRAGLANQPTSVSADDGLRLHGAYVAAAVRCAPPANRPRPDERDHCVPYLVRELSLLGKARVIVALGGFAWDCTVRALAALGHRTRPRPTFAHGAAASVGPYRLLGCYHPSQRNTFTGRLTPASIDAVIVRALTVPGAASLEERAARRDQP